MANGSDEELTLGNFSPPGSVESGQNGPLTPGMVKSPEGEDGSGESSSGGLKRKLSGRKDLKVCSICGDTALGCNFDAISCESCKAFFRRNALKDKKTKCVFSGDCKIDINTRKFCPHCRLLKCFTVGMKKELILGTAEKEKRRQKVKQNREVRGGSARKRARKSNENDDSFSMVGSPIASSPAPDQSFILQSPVASPLSSPNVKLEQNPVPIPAQNTSQNPPPVGDLVQAPSPAIPEYIVLPPVSTISSGVQMPAATAVSPLPPMQSASPLPTMPLFSLPPAPLPSNPASPAPSNCSQQSNMSCNLLNAANYMQMPDAQEVQICSLDDNEHRQMTVEENNILSELLQIYDLSFTADLEPLVHIKQLDPTLNQLVNQSSITVLRIIKFAKRLEEFVSLPQECQIGILKGTWIHILLLRSVSMYDCERDLWVTPRVAIPTEILKNATGYVQLHDDHVNYCKDIKAMIRDDISLITIMLVVVLFSPEGQHVTLRALISNVQDKYLLLLKHYIEWKYGFEKAADMYPDLISKMKALKELAEVHGKYLLDVNPREIEPIMLEILDLK